MNKLQLPVDIEIELYQYQMRVSNAMKKAYDLPSYSQFLDRQRAIYEEEKTPEYLKALAEFREYKQTTMEYDTETVDADSPGHRLTLVEFVECVESGGFIDYDGGGNYMVDKNTLTNITVSPSDVLEGRIRKDMKYVMWYNR